eukprot:TRINITY_DN603_c0_g3_i3.p1 TRINITY_DN603_c0_g3~~TRINITY_DN603_c0_g3_i3.p1  ORF type:complete len:186 (-),score=32.53 TRINITY_DN603_c0_g3_i3:99-656(-)
MMKKRVIVSSFSFLPTRLLPSPSPSSLILCRPIPSISSYPTASTFTTVFQQTRKFSTDTQKTHPPTLDLSNPSGTVFAKIIKGELPCKKVYEDEHALAFHDLSPVAPVHVLIIPKTPIASIAKAEEKDKEALGNLMYAANKTAEALGLQNDGYRLVINHGKHGQQTVGYLHVHLIAGKQLKWPPG